MAEENADEQAEEPTEEAVSEDAELEKELESEEEQERLPFPNARVVRLLKSELDPDKMVRARVKKELNEWLGELVRRISREINKSPYTVVEAQDLHKATKKYDQLDEVAQQKERLISYMNRIRGDCNILIEDVEKSFDVGGNVRRGRKLSAAAQEEQDAQQTENEEE